MEALASPITAFINECCIVAPDRSVPINTLYGRFKSWCEEHGRRPETEQVFGRNIRAALPTLECQQKRSCGTRQRIYIGLDLI
jgi:putative DNA primase/helicase